AAERAPDVAESAEGGAGGRKTEAAQRRRLSRPLGKSGQATEELLALELPLELTFQLALPLALVFAFELGQGLEFVLKHGRFSSTDGLTSLGFSESPADDPSRPRAAVRPLGQPG